MVLSKHVRDWVRPQLSIVFFITYFLFLWASAISFSVTLCHEAESGRGSTGISFRLMLPEGSVDSINIQSGSFLFQLRNPVYQFFCCAPHKRTLFHPISGFHGGTVLGCCDYSLVYGEQTELPHPVLQSLCCSPWPSWLLSLFVPSCWSLAQWSKLCVVLNREEKSLILPLLLLMQPRTVFAARVHCSFSTNTSSPSLQSFAAASLFWACITARPAVFLGQNSALVLAECHEPSVNHFSSFSRTLWTAGLLLLPVQCLKTWQQGPLSALPCHCQES